MEGRHTPIPRTMKACWADAVLGLLFCGSSCGGYEEEDEEEEDED